jgi:hypothetical protein
MPIALAGVCLPQQPLPRRLDFVLLEEAAYMRRKRVSRRLRCLLSTCVLTVLIDTAFAQSFSVKTNRIVTSGAGGRARRHIGG